MMSDVIITKESRGILFGLILCVLNSCSDSLISYDLCAVNQCSNIECEKFNAGTEYYHESTNSLIKETGDPYRYENMKVACNELIEKGQIANENILQATHYVLKIYPRNMREQYEIENMSDVNVSYIPFSYSYVAHDINMNVAKSSIQIYKEDYKYVVESIYDEVSSDSIVKNKLLMPLLYVTWPKDKLLPKNYDYQIEYEMVNPYYSNNAKGINVYNDSFSKSEMRLIERESIRQNIIDSRSYSNNECINVSGAIFYKNVFSQSTPPLHNLQVRFQLGSVMWEVMTNSSGEYVIRDSLPVDATYSIRFWHPKWRLTREGTTTPIAYTMGTVGELWSNSSNYRVAYRKDSRPLFESHVAVNYYYHGNHGIPKYVLSNGIRIETLDVTDTLANGYFRYSSSSAPYIQIFNNNKDKPAEIMGTVLHELGHNVMYQAYGSYSLFKNTDKFIKESWSSFCGWYLCRKYYETLGITEQDGLNSFSGQAWQYWERSFNHSQLYSHYSPILIDLMDTYNQATSSTAYNNDPISSVPISAIIDFGITYKTWEEYRDALEDYVGGYYSSTRFDNYIAPYDYFWGQ